MNNYLFPFPNRRPLRTLGPSPACSFGAYWPIAVAGFLNVAFAILFDGFETKLSPKLNEEPNLIERYATNGVRKPTIIGRTGNSGGR